MKTTDDPKRELLRHMLATLAYRCGKAVRDAPEGFASYRAAHDTRTPGEILAHIGDLLDWALTLAIGEQKWNDAQPLPWNTETDRFFDTLRKLDDYLASDAPLDCSCEGLSQGPVADALTHVGQIALLRRMAGAAIHGENYFVADIQMGRTGPAQSKARKEF